MKVRNLKANHSHDPNRVVHDRAVLASMKVRNLKANHSSLKLKDILRGAVLASVKVRNLKANHNRGLCTTAHLVVIAIGCWSAYG